LPFCNGDICRQVKTWLGVEYEPRRHNVDKHLCEACIYRTFRIS